MKSQTITQAYAKSIIDYDPETGEFDRIDGRSLRRFTNTSGYLCFRIEAERGGELIRVRSHRLAWLIMTGESPAVLDHINGDRTDNKWSNLRKVDKAANAWNRAKAKNNKSGVKGVSETKDGKWACRVDVRGRRHWLGAYADIELAEFIVAEFRLSMHGEYANAG
ncbi:hypothetical protein D3C78_849640 [compost metagenome]